MITDVQLTVVSDEVRMLESEEAMTQKRFQVMEGADIVDLECSLGLAKHLNMQLEFVFTPADSNASGATKTVLCNSESNQRVDNWVVTPTMNSNTCHLKIVNVSKADGGQYDCLMVLNNSHTSYNQDRSNAIILAVESPKHQDKYYDYVIPLIIIAAIAIVCSTILVAFKIRDVKKRKNYKHHLNLRPASGMLLVIIIYAVFVCLFITSSIYIVIIYRAHACMQSTISMAAMVLQYSVIEVSNF
jgi:hypothetical protein